MAMVRARTTMLALLVMAMTATATATEPSTGVGACVESRILCASPLKHGNVSKECCDTPKPAMETQLSCLCALFTNKHVLAAFGLTVEKALQIPVKCGLHVDPNMCSNPPSKAPSPSPAPTPTAAPPTPPPIAPKAPSPSPSPSLSPTAAPPMAAPPMAPKAPSSSPAAAPPAESPKDEKSGASKLTGTLLVGFILMSMTLMFN